jgi:hypothetical protein
MFKPEALSQFGIPNNFCNYPKKTCIFLDGLWMDREVFRNAEYRVFAGGFEPTEVLNAHYSQQDLINNADKFDLILTNIPEVLNTVKHSHLFPLGSSWVKKDFKKIDTFYEVSFLCGPKNYLKGHNLRHEIFNKIHNIKNIPVKSMFSIDPKNKNYIFNTSQFSIIVENTVRENHFTEKIVDCLVTKTIPLYYGCPNIGDFFNKKGIITFKNSEELFLKISFLNENIYQEKLDIIEENFFKALDYADFHKRVDKIILEQQSKL